MTSANKIPANWTEALRRADQVEEIALLALEMILDRVGSEYTASTMVMERELRIREAIRLLELHEVDRALTVLKGGQADGREED